MNNPRNQKLPVVFVSCMKRKVGVGVLTVFLVILMIGAGRSAFAGIRGNPYQSIVERNPFGLRAIPAPTAPAMPTPPATPLPEIKLTGVTTLLGRSKALFQYEDKQTKKVEFPSPLSEGQTYKTLTVLHIDVANARVRIRNGDKESTLDFVNNGVKVATKAQPAPRPPIANTIPRPVPPRLIPNNPVASNPNSRVIVLGPPGTTPALNPSLSGRANVRTQPMSREQAELLMEMTRRKLQGQQVQPASLGGRLSQPPVRRLR